MHPVRVFVLFFQNKAENSPNLKILMKRESVLWKRYQSLNCRECLVFFSLLPPLLFFCYSISLNLPPVFLSSLPHLYSLTLKHEISPPSRFFTTCHDFDVAASFPAIYLSVLFWHFSHTAPDMPCDWRVTFSGELLLVLCHSSEWSSQHRNFNLLS